MWRRNSERARLFGILEELVLWENTTNEEVLERARTEIWQSWRRACAENAGHSRAADLFDRHTLPAFHDPFAGGGALPLEAQRLGLEAHASDLNPVAVLINKAMIEIPPKFAGRPPVNPESLGELTVVAKTWRGAQGLAEDVRHYGRWMRDEAEKRIGHLYPPVEVISALVRERLDLKPYEGRQLTVIAWLWARTVKSPNPAFADVDVPLASTFYVSSIATMHKALGETNPLESTAVRFALQRMHRHRGRRQSQVLGLTWPLRKRLLEAVGDRLIDARDRALLAVGYDTLLRRAELVSVKVADLLEEIDGTATVLVRAGKTDGEGRGATLFVARDTLQLVKTWLGMGGIDGGNLFRSVGKDETLPIGEKLNPSQVPRIYKRMARQAGMPADALSLWSPLAVLAIGFKPGLWLHENLAPTQAVNFVPHGRLAVRSDRCRATMA